MNPQSKIFTDKRSKNAIRIFTHYDFDLVSSAEKADLLWVRKESKQYAKSLQPFQLLNHFIHENILTNKGHITEALKHYEKNHIYSTDKSISMHDFFPETYCLNDTKEQHAFMQQQPQTEDPENTWIYKPGGNSRGRGIQILWQTRQLAANNFYPPGHYDDDANRVIQRYLKNPLLIHNRKFDIRVYWLLASIDPLLVLLYPQGKVRLTAMPYKNEDFDNPLVHMTNYYQQKMHPEFDSSLRYKWSYSELDQYLYEANITELGFCQNQLMPKIRQYIAHVVQAGKSRLLQDYPKQGDCFGVYGADFLVDENLQPFMTEIQKGPGLRMGDPVEQNIIPYMLHQAINIVLNIRKRRMTEKTLTTLHTTVGDYQWVINEAEKK